MTPNKAPRTAKGERAAAFRLLAETAAPERAGVWHGLLWLVVAAALEMLAPVLGKHLIDAYLLPRQADVPMMAALLAGMLITGWLASGLRYLQLVRLSGVAMRSVRRLRERVYSHVLNLPMHFFDQAITGQLVSRVTNDTEAVKGLYVQVLFVFLDSSIVCLGALGAMALLDIRLMLMVLVLLPAVLLIVRLYQHWSAPAVSRARAARSEINAQVSESIAGMLVLQASNASGRFSQRFNRINQDYYHARLAELKVNAWLLRPMLDLLNVALLAVVIYSFGQRTPGGMTLGGLEIGLLYAFISYIARVVEPLIQITLQFSQIQQSVVAAERVNTLLAEPLAVVPQATGKISAGALTMQQVAFGYQAEQPVLHDLNLHIPAGSFIGIVGHTGSGKSTLLALLLRFYQAQSGSIEVDGNPLATIGDAEFRAKVGLVPQDPFLLAATARENIDMGRGLAQDAIEAAARAAHAHDFILALEYGYDTPLGEGGARLAVGQKQLLAIARALAGKPRILLLDEATSHIDSQTEQIVQLALQALRGQVTIIAIAHRLSTIRNADTIVVLSHGRVVESGGHDTLMAMERGIYQRLYLLQQIVD